MKVLLGIPAYNEENNIGELLDGILKQKIDKNILKEVLVVSDHSTDKTDKIVLLFAKKYKNINLIIRKKRLGKSSALNLIFNIANKYDALILLDADVRLDSNALKILIDRMSNSNDISLVAGNPIPFPPDSRLNIAEHASFFSWVLLDQIKNTSTPNLYHAHGRILALSKELYSQIKIPKDVNAGNDQYIYFSSIEKSLKFEYEPNARVHYKLPKTINDYLKQNVRFSIAIKEKKRIFGKSFVMNHMNITNKFPVFFKIFLQYPYKGLCWITLFIIGRILIITKKTNVSPTWEISRTTK